MVSSRLPSQRARAAGFAVGGLALAYAALSVYYFYADWFKYLEDGKAVYVDRTGFLVSVNGAYLWSILSPWRILGAVLAVSLAGVSAVALWQNRPRARVLALFTLWGVLLPQVLWYAEFAVDWHRGSGLGAVLFTGLAAALIPTLIMTRGLRTIGDWSDLSCSRLRLLATGVVFAWIGFAATEFLDHSYVLRSDTAVLGALLAVGLAAIAAGGIVRLRTYGLLAGVAAACALALVPLAAMDTQLLPAYGAGYIDGFTRAVAGSDGRALLASMAPLAVVVGLAGPFLAGMWRKLRD